MTTANSLPSPPKPPPGPNTPRRHRHRHHQQNQTEEQNHLHCQQEERHDQRDQNQEELLQAPRDQQSQQPQKYQPHQASNQNQQDQHQSTRKQRRRSSPPNLALPPPLPPPPPARLPLLPPPRRTNPIVWCIAVCCLFLAVVVFVSAILTLVLFLAIRPRLPSLDIPNANLESLYLDSPALLNGDLTLIVNISNPNHRIDVAFELLNLELDVGNTFVSTQMIEPFRAQSGGWTAFSVHFMTSQVVLNSDDVIVVRQMIAGEKVRYELKTAFRTRATLGPGHLTYWLRGLCSLVVSGPPNGMLVSRSCRTRRCTSAYILQHAFVRWDEH